MLGTAAPAAASADSAPASVQDAFAAQTSRAGGTWYVKVLRADGAGGFAPVLSLRQHDIVYGASVQKLAVAATVLDKVDRGLLSLSQKVTLDAGTVLDGSGLYFHQTVWGDQITVAGFLTAMLLVSDNTAVRLCGALVPTAEINEILAAKGFTHTRVEPGSTPNRFFLGTTTPHEMTDLLARLANKTLLSPASCEFMLGILRGGSGYHDGVRRDMSSDERDRVATKHGAFDDARHEAGIMFDATGAPAAVYGFFADGMEADAENYGGTHPAVRAHALLGRVLFDRYARERVANPAARTASRPFRPYNGN
ncbi:serine hydrolase [Actinorhabdospora filicis]|uniref:Serine hydrolase n=1 Tax=Actinorhabdospora filicis TaxID=1785913 RepID=A0A9W6SS59_9ACTN|nr:serine hydrolase [Actinorhabdospora filicis]